MSITISVNGAQRTVSADADKPLLWVLREDLEMPGTKFGCGIGMCGACTVHVDGQAVRSCQIAIGDADGMNITTIEAVGQSEAGRHILESWSALNVPQCGYCQAGQIMSATALLSGNANPGDADIDAAMQGNICRCATYTRIRAAIKAAAQTAKG